MATAGHQGFSANIFTITSDMFPKPTIGSVVSFGGFTGGMGGAILLLSAGWLRQNMGGYGYAVMFTIAGFAYFAALAAIHILAPRLEPARLRAAS
jgi:ACS family hexuronate transporter-like MFS transporter